jgi:peptidoglycan/xylan/chitin deacetylase (PgdA/CDA1 family)
MMGWRHFAAAAFDSAGGTRLLGRWFGRQRLTVLAYHRVADPYADGFAGFVRNVSATPESFVDQMQWMARNTNPVSEADVVAAIGGVAPLPERASLVTFDDGYRDNYDAALPILREHSIPAIVFLATDHIGTARPLWWDRAAWSIEHASRHPASIPILGAVNWNDLHTVAVDWIESAKRVDTPTQRAALDELVTMLEPPSPNEAFSRMHLDWDVVREMQSHGVTFGGHTKSHPVLSRLESDAARAEVIDSIERVAAETGRPVVSFAYPNGLEGDFDDSHVAAVRDAGASLGFTLVPGPARKREFLADPYRIRRVYVHHKNDRPVFSAKVAGLPRLIP